MAGDTQQKLKIAKKRDPIRFISLEGWVARPGQFNVGAGDDFDEAMRRIRAVGFHVIRMDVIERPLQGYRLTVVGGNYQPFNMPAKAANETKPAEQTDLL